MPFKCRCVFIFHWEASLGISASERNSLGHGGVEAAPIGAPEANCFEISFRHILHFLTFRTRRPSRAEWPQIVKLVPRSTAWEDSPSRNCIQENVIWPPFLDGLEREGQQAADQNE